MRPAKQAFGLRRSEETPLASEIAPDRNTGKEFGRQFKARHIDRRLRGHDVEHLVAQEGGAKAEETGAVQKLARLNGRTCDFFLSTASGHLPDSSGWEK